MTIRMKIMIGAGVAIGLLVIVTVILIFVNQPTKGVLDTTTMNTNSAQPLSEVGVSVSETVARIIAGADPSICRAFQKTSDADQCTFTVAAETSEIASCDSISETSLRDSCRGVVTTNRVRSTGTADACLTLVDPVTRDNCIAVAVDGGADKTFCAKLSAPETTRCLDRIQLIASATDKKACAGITDPQVRIECDYGASQITSESPSSLDGDHDGLTDVLEKTYGTDPKNPDTDGDGLTDGQEVNTYHTDPVKSDTDGDGYADGAEVTSGHNPSGPG